MILPCLCGVRDVWPCCELGVNFCFILCVFGLFCPKRQFLYCYNHSPIVQGTSVLLPSYWILFLVKDRIIKKERWEVWPDTQLNLCHYSRREELILGTSTPSTHKYCIKRLCLCYRQMFGKPHLNKRVLNIIWLFTLPTIARLAHGWLAPLSVEHGDLMRHLLVSLKLCDRLGWCCSNIALL